MAFLCVTCDFVYDCGVWDIYFNEIFVIVINSNEFGRWLSLYVCVGAHENQSEDENDTLFSH